MLTDAQLDRLCVAGDLRLWTPTDGPLRRFIWFPRPVWAAIDTFIASVSTGRAAALIDDLNQFAGGRLLTVGERGYLKKLKPPPLTDDWSMRSLARPQFRILGAFARPDHFVPLYADHRAGLQSSGWAGPRADGNAIWRSLFGTELRHTGACIRDYVTENTDPHGHQPIP